MSDQRQLTSTQLMSPLETAWVEHCRAGTDAEWRAFVCYCQASYEVPIYRALIRCGPRYREYARDAFQDLCCVLLVNLPAVLAAFAEAGVSIRTYLTRWVRRRVWELMRRRDDRAQSSVVENVPEPADSGLAEEVEERVQRLKERARAMLPVLTSHQRRFVKLVLEGKFAEALKNVSQGALRVMLHRMRQRLRQAAEDNG